MRIEIDMLPPIECSPNYRGHWFERYRAAREYSAAVFYKCIDMRNRMMASGEFVCIRVARLNLTLIFPRLRVRDDDNLWARFKPGRDALVMAGVIEADDIKHLHIGELRVIINRSLAPKTIIELLDEEEVPSNPGPVCLGANRGEPRK